MDLDSNMGIILLMDQSFPASSFLTDSQEQYSIEDLGGIICRNWGILLHKQKCHPTHANLFIFNQFN